MDKGEVSIRSVNLEGGEKKTLPVRLHSATVFHPSKFRAIFAPKTPLLQGSCPTCHKADMRHYYDTKHSRWRWQISPWFIYGLEIGANDGEGGYFNRKNYSIENEGSNEGRGRR